MRDRIDEVTNLYGGLNLLRGVHGACPQLCCNALSIVVHNTGALYLYEGSYTVYTTVAGKHGMCALCKLKVIVQ